MWQILTCKKQFSIKQYVMLSNITPSIPCYAALPATLHCLLCQRTLGSSLNLRGKGHRRAIPLWPMPCGSAESSGRAVCVVFIIRWQLLYSGLSACCSRFWLFSNKNPKTHRAIFMKKAIALKTVPSSN